MSRTARTQKLNLNTRIGDRFEPIPITPREMVKSLVCDDTKIKGREKASERNDGSISVVRILNGSDTRRI